TGSWRRISVTLRCKIFFSTSISRELSKERSRNGGSSFQQLLSLAYRFPHFVPRWRITTVIAQLAFLRISCKRNAISLVRTPTRGSTNPASSTLTGWSPRKRQLKNRPHQKRLSRITPGSKHSSTATLPAWNAADESCGGTGLQRALFGTTLCAKI